VQNSRVVLLVEGDRRLASFLDRSLASAGYLAECARDPNEALQHQPDVILLQLARGGLELIRELRARTDVPIFVVSATNCVGDGVAALDAGADDFLAVPFATEELLARLRAVLRGRALGSEGAIKRANRGRLTYADLWLNLDTREVMRGDRKVDVRNKTFELLTCFMRHPERVLSRRELLGDVWGYDFLGDSNVIEVTVSHLRQALEAAEEPRLIQTVRPVGYILKSRA
jgi:two-component system, OmpR family, response regulator MprA